jgi:hypothetical protein
MVIDAQSELRTNISGSFTISSSGKIIVSTLPGHITKDALQDIASLVIKMFANSIEVQRPISEIKIFFDQHIVSIRPLRGGAIVIVTPSLKSKS